MIIDIHHTSRRNNWLLFSRKIFVLSTILLLLFSLSIPASHASDDKVTGIYSCECSSTALEKDGPQLWFLSRKKDCSEARIPFFLNPANPIEGASFRSPSQACVDKPTRLITNAELELQTLKVLLEKLSKELEVVKQELKVLKNR